MLLLGVCVFNTIFPNLAAKETYLQNEDSKVATKFCASQSHVWCQSYCSPISIYVKELYKICK